MISYAAQEEILKLSPDAGKQTLPAMAPSNGDIVVNTTDIPQIHHVVRLSKDAGRRLDDNKSEDQIRAIMSAGVNNQRQARGWSVEFAEENRNRRFRVVGDQYEGYTYSIDVIVECKPSKLRSTLAQEFDNIVAFMDQKARIPANRWKVASVDGKDYIPTDVQSERPDASEELGYAPFEIPSDDKWLSEKRDGSGAFDHLYGLDDYIWTIKRALEAAVKSGWRNRINLELQGPPACGKSDICKSLKRLVGDEAVLEFDATSTTMAGAQEELNQREELPRVLLIEEIEKAPEAAMQWLLSVLDLRGEIRKKTARSEILKEVHMVGICTVNNQELFAKLQSGALQSRFAEQLEFRRPTRDLLWKILYREIQNMEDGDEAWIEPALDYAEEIDTTDPRRVIAICLIGREELVSGEYQKRMRRINPSRAKMVASFTPPTWNDER